MTINLNTEELSTLVGKHVDSLGLTGDYKISFNKRNQNNIDTVIEILPVGSNDETEAEDTQDSEATELTNSLIRQ